MNDLTPSELLRDWSARLTDLQKDDLWDRKYSGRTVAWFGNIESIKGGESVIHICVLVDIPKTLDFASYELRVRFTAEMSEKHHYVQFSIHDRVKVEAQLRDYGSLQRCNIIDCGVNIRRLTAEPHGTVA